MRKAGKQRIRAALVQYADWRAKIDAQIAGLALEQARAYLTEWADDVRGRIEAGELGACTFALSASVVRDIKAWQTGYYTGFTANGGRRVA